MLPAGESGKRDEAGLLVLLVAVVVVVVVVVAVEGVVAVGGVDLSLIRACEGHQLLWVYRVGQYFVSLSRLPCLSCS